MSVLIDVFRVLVFSFFPAFSRPQSVALPLFAVRRFIRTTWACVCVCEGEASGVYPSCWASQRVVQRDGTPAEDELLTVEDDNNSDILVVTTKASYLEVHSHSHTHTHTHTHTLTHTHTHTHSLPKELFLIRNES